MSSIYPFEELKLRNLPSFSKDLNFTFRSTMKSSTLIPLLALTQMTYRSASFQLSFNFRVFAFSLMILYYLVSFRSVRHFGLNTLGSGQNYYTRTGPTKPQNSWWCLPAPPLLTSKDGVFIAWPPLYPAVKNYSEIQTSLFLFV